ncbi:MAG: NB-ARC domain-containing protein [Elainellaceae cyanobacterium]
MSTQRPKRIRGVQLTAIGYDRFYRAKQAAEDVEKNGDRLTLEELNERTGLSLGTLTRVLNRDGVVDKRTLTLAFRAFGLDLAPEDFVKPQVIESVLPPTQTLAEAVADVSPTVLNRSRYDWGSAVDISQFQHRQDELQALHQWIEGDRCRLVALLGLGGMGKTYLSVKLGRQIQGNFDRVIWRSLRHSPSVESLLEDVVTFLTGQPVPNASLNQLISALQAERCLMILDNLESVLQPDPRVGTWQPGYEGYGELLRQLGTASHQSCLLLTSREKPPEIASLAGHASVQSLTLRGCSDVSLAILQTRGLNGSLSQFHQLCKRYGGVPLALTITATLIQDLFGGDVGQFLAQQTWILGDLNHLLAEQFNRLNSLERAIAYWLAINGEPTTIADLERDLTPSVPRGQLLESLESLRRRSLMESQQGCFTLQSVVMDYVSNQWLDEACKILTLLPNEPVPDVTCLHTHALLKAQASSQVQMAQRTRFVQPLLHRLLENTSVRYLTHRLKARLTTPGTAQTYWAGNLVNLLIQLQADLSGQSFANLTLWQVDFHNVNLAQTSFHHADLSRCCFSHTFGPVYDLAFSRDGSTLVTGHGDGTLRQWALDGRLRQQYQHSSSISTLAFSFDGATLAIGTFDGSIHLYDGAEELKPRRSLCLHDDWVYDLDFLPDGDRLASGSSDGTLLIWDHQTEAEHQHFEMGPITALSVSQDGWLVSSDENGLLQLWHEDQANPWQSEQGSSLVSVTLSPDGNLAASADTQALYLWQRQGNTLQPLWQASLSSAWTMAFSPDGQTLAVTDGATIQIFDALTSCPIHTLAAHASQVWSLAFDPSGALLASGSDDQIVLWQVSSGQIWRTWKTATTSDSPILAARFSSDGRLLVSGDGQGDVRLWDSQTHHCLDKLSGHTTPVRAVAIAALHSTDDDGSPAQPQWVASGSDQGVVSLWDLKTRTHRVVLNHTAGVTALAFSENGEWLASGSLDGCLYLWDVRQNRLHASFAGHEGRVLAIAFSPDGQWIATGSSDYNVRLWHRQQTSPVVTFTGHQGWIWAVAFSPDGQYLASGSGDRTIKLWDVSKQTCIQTLQNHEKLVWTVAFWPDVKGETSRLVSGSLDQTIKVWDIVSGEVLDTLQAKTDLLWAIQPVDERLTIAGTQANTLQLWSMDQQEPRACLAPQLLYEGMDITQVRGLAPATLKSLEELGARVTPYLKPPESEEEIGAMRDNIHIEIDRAKLAR